MKVLILGGTGFIGREIARQLSSQDSTEVVVASRHAQGSSAGSRGISVDARDKAALTRAFAGVDAVVNCVTGDADAIVQGAETLVQAALDSGRPRLVHMSSMAVYGGDEGLLDESHPMRDVGWWYGRAKIEAEASFDRYRQAGGNAVILRPGCVAGAGSADWVARLARLLELGRLGDLGAAGDGPTNLVDVTDVAQAVVNALSLPPSPNGVPRFNLAAPDGPRWNTYFTDLALGLGATPVKRLTARAMKREIYLRGIALKVAERLAKKLGARLDLPPAITPTLTRLWAQQIQLDSTAATRELRLSWTPYAETLRRSVDWWRGSR
jgi:nucleoside-diphosphate-sugar epimerase